MGRFALPRCLSYLGEHRKPETPGSTASGSVAPNAAGGTDAPPHPTPLRPSAAKCSDFGPVTCTVAAARGGGGEALRGAGLKMWHQTLLNGKRASTCAEEAHAQTQLKSSQKTSRAAASNASRSSWETP